MHEKELRGKEKMSGFERLIIMTNKNTWRFIVKFSNLQRKSTSNLKIAHQTNQKASYANVQQNLLQG